MDTPVSRHFRVGCSRKKHVSKRPILHETCTIIVTVTNNIIFIFLRRMFTFFFIKFDNDGQKLKLIIHEIRYLRND